MTDATADAPAEDEGTPKKKGSKLPMLIGLVLALAGGGDRFLANMTEGLGALMQANTVGRRITVSAGDKINQAVLA